MMVKPELLKRFESYASLQGQTADELLEKWLDMPVQISDSASSTDNQGAEKNAFSLNEQIFRTIADWTHDWEYWISPQQQVIYISSAVERITGYPKEAFIADPLLINRLIMADDLWIWDQHHKLHQDHVPSDAVEELEFRIITRKGAIIWIHHVCRAVFDEQGKYLGRRASNRDITARKEAELAHRESEARFHSYFELGLIGIVMISTDKRWLDVNDKACQIIGYSRAELLQMSWADVTHPDDMAASLAAWNDVLAGKNNGYTLEKRYIRKDGQVIYVQIDLSFVRQADGSLSYAVALLQDITERRQSILAQQESEARLRQAMRVAHLGIWDWDIATDRTIWMGDIFQMYGITPEEFTGHGSDYFRFTLPEDRQMQQNNIQKAFKRGVSERELTQGGATVPLNPKGFRILRPDKTICYVQGDAVAVVDEAGQPLRMIGVLQDITAQKEAEEALRIKDSAIASSITAIALADLNGKLTYVNPAFLRLWKLEHEQEALGQSVLDFWETLEEAQAVVRAIQEKGNHHGEMIARLSDGTQAHLEFTASMVTNAAGDHLCMMGSFNDITERKLAENTLRQSEERYRWLAENVTDMISRHLPNGTYTYVTPSCQALLGYTPSELTGQGVDKFIHPEDLANVREIHRHVLRQPIAYTFEYRIRHKNGDYLWFETTEYLVRDELTTHPLEIIAISRDITERKHKVNFLLEYERLKASFKKEQQQNTLIQRVISSLSHDLRTPLAVISTSKDILSLHFDKLTPERRQEKLNVIGHELQFALNLLDDTVTMVRGNLSERDFQLAPINLDTLCRLSIDAIRETYSPISPMIYVNQANISVMPIDETLVSRILLNLLSNAVKYSPTGGEIRLELDRQGEKIILRVTDQGLGIHEQDLLHIFEPFYRSNDVYTIKGTGLGLSIVKDCVERHQGHIRVESTLGQGSMFIVELPIIALEASAATA